MNWSSKSVACPASGRVIKAEGDKVWLNLGKDVVSPGDVLKVKSKGEELIDPDTGISLGSADTEIGTVRVSQAAGEVQHCPGGFYHWPCEARR